MIKRINNNKAFAISALLYGLLILAVVIVFMIVTLANFNKKTSSDFVNEIEKDLINWSIEMKTAGVCTFITF